MRTKVAATLTLAALAACSRGPASESSSAQTDATLQASLLQKEQQLLDAVALGDTSVWLANLHDSCLIALEDGSTTTKREMVEGLRPLPAGYVGKIHVIEPRFRRHGDAAVVSFVADEYLDLFDQHIHTQYRQSDTWMRFGDQWQIVSMQVFEIPANPQPITLEASILRRHAGTYELAADKRCEITVDDGKLVAHKADRPPQELLPETETVFFRPNDGRVRVLFYDGSMIERRAGQDLRWRRVQ